jgi:hypothetical protein
MTTDRPDTTTTDEPDSADDPCCCDDSQQIDIELLAEKVYRLLLTDLRLEQARSGQLLRGRNRL